MGVPGLARFFSSCIKEKSYSDYEYKTLAVDVTYQIYKYVMIQRSKGYDLTNKNGEMVTHIKGIFEFTLKCLKNKIIPLYVFDGKPPELKKETLIERKNIKMEALKKLETLSDSDEEFSKEYIDTFKKSFILKESHCQDIKDLLNLMGIKYINAPGEADSQLAALASYSDSKIDGVITEDSDVVIFGAKKIIKNFDGEKVKELNLTDIINYLNKIANKIRKKHKIRKTTKINYSNFVDFGILMGCDYIRPIKNLSYEDLFEEYVIADFDVRETLRILKIKEDLFNIEIPNTFIEQWKKAKEYFLNPEVFEPRNTDLEFGILNKFKLKQYLIENCNLNNNKVEIDVNNLELYIDNIKYHDVNNNITNTDAEFDKIKMYNYTSIEVEYNENPSNIIYDDFDLPIVLNK